MSGLQMITPDIATLAGQLQMATRRAELAEQEASKNEARLRQEIGLRVEMMSQLIGRNLPIPARLKLSQEPLRITSRAGQVQVIVPDGLATIETGAAAERLIASLIEHCRAAFPESFTGVF